jgi:TetR/AcrR family transcriptional repressor of lmrAB and yxaGH operons
MGRAGARELAEVVVSSVEGALVTARAFRSPAPFDSILAALMNHAAQVGISETSSTSELAQSS